MTDGAPPKSWRGATSLVLVALMGVAASADDNRGLVSTDGHERSTLKPPDTYGFSDADLKRLQRLETGVMCKCERENWARTLTNCPDSCADQQKREIRQMMKEGRSDTEILAFMEGEYGSKVRAAPLWAGTGKWSYLIPFIVLLGGAVIAAGVLQGWSRDARGRREGREALADLVSEEELAAVDRELEKIEE